MARHRKIVEFAGRAPGSRVAMAKGASIERERTQCPAGHPYDESNTYGHSGKRRCRACNRISVARRRAGL